MSLDIHVRAKVLIWLMMPRVYLVYEVNAQYPDMVHSNPKVIMAMANSCCLIAYQKSYSNIIARNGTVHASASLRNIICRRHAESIK